jgi:hypothetical protein
MTSEQQDFGGDTASFEIDVHANHVTCPAFSQYIRIVFNGIV